MAIDVNNVAKLVKLLNIDRDSPTGKFVYFYLNKNKMRKGKFMKGYIVHSDYCLGLSSVKVNDEYVYESVLNNFIFDSKKDALKYTKNYRKTYKDRLAKKYQRRLDFIQKRIDDINQKWDRIKRCQLENLSRLREENNIGTSPFNRRIYEARDVYFIDDFIIKKGKDNGMLRKGRHKIYLYEDEFGIENGYSDEIYYNVDDLVKAFNIRIDELRNNELKSILLKRDKVEKDLEKLQK